MSMSPPTCNPWEQTQVADPYTSLNTLEHVRIRPKLALHGLHVVASPSLALQRAA